jgi:signal transduction histidine kinase
MGELVHDILDVAQVSSGNFSVDLSREIDLRDVVKRAVRLNYDYALRRNVSLKVEMSDEVKAVKLDAKRMKQVLTNLISNAVKYSPAHKEVKIICKNNSEFLEISVIDQGFGMSAAQIETAFEKYQTIQNPNSGSVDSFGLGLPITKQLVELQNGAIEVNSEVGKGTEMKIKFPLQLM